MMEKKSQRPTLKSIAQEIGMTANTVSLALRGSPRVTEATRARVLEAAKAQGYVQDMQASSLRKGQSQIIALVFGDIANPLYSIKMKKLEEVLRKEGYQILIFNSDEQGVPGREYEVMRTAISRKIDGMICTPSPRGREALDLLAQYGVPCVVVGRYLDDNKEDCVVWDNEAGARIATRYLLDHGCKQPLYIASYPDSISSERDRLKGFIGQMMEYGMTEEQVHRQCLFLRGRSMKEALDESKVAFDGIFAYRDQLAWEAATLVPSDTLIIGYDNVQANLPLPIHIPSIGADMEQEARMVADLLLSRIENPDRPPVRKVLPVHLVER
ncbi:MAG: LacI family DNA-binding transcriptional regulator [bacterium]|nr:LacI family DNA-binding transcriptional regulator [bacterium]